MPANSHEPHCTGRPYSEADLPPGFPDKKPTSRMSRPRHEAAAPAPVARCDRADLTARSPVLPALLHPTGFPVEEATRRHGAPIQRNNLAAGCPNGEAVRSMGRLRFEASVGAPVARNIGGALRGTGCSSCGIAVTARLPERSLAAPLRRSVPRGVVSATVSRSATSSSRHGCPCWRHSASHSCPCEAFPRHRVTPMTSGLRCEPLTSWLPSDESVANSASILRSPA